jgi:F-type H+-transporting ATPase subunit b
MLARAAEGEATWRGTYDVIMMWINFGILAFLLVKFARAPLMDLLKGEVKKTAAGLEQAREGKNRVDRDVQDTLKALENARERLRGVRERIVTEGQRQRQRIIESAQHESRLMLERTRQKIDHEIFQAHEQLRAEIIDRAVDAALERLPGLMTADDQKKWLETFIRSA